MTVNGRRLSEYSTRCTWMRNSKFLKDLEADNVDSDIIDEELRILQEGETAGFREKLVKFLESNPWQIFTCVLVLLDAIVVVAEILLDLNGLRSQYREAKTDLHLAIDFLKELFIDDLFSYDGDNIEYVLNLLRAKHSSLPSPAEFLHAPSLKYAESSSDVTRLRHHHHGNHFLSPDGAENTATVRQQTGSAFQSLGDRTTIANTSKVVMETATVRYYKLHSYSNSLFKVAHVFHYLSIAVLGLFVFQVIMKVFGMGGKFFKKKMEIFDAMIILASFTLDLVFLEGLAEVQGEEAMALLVVFLLWRVLRVINGMMVAAERRQEFRVRLQKRARRMAEKRIEYLEDEKNWKEREVLNLRHLCRVRGVNDDQIAICRPMRRSVYQKMDTSTGLSTIASLSLVVSMSMSRSGRTLLARSVMRYGSRNLPLIAILPGACASSRSNTTSSNPSSSQPTTHMSSSTPSRATFGQTTSSTTSNSRFSRSSDDVTSSGGSNCVYYTQTSDVIPPCHDDVSDFWLRPGSFRSHRHSTGSANIVLHTHNRDIDSNNTKIGQEAVQMSTAINLPDDQEIVNEEDDDKDEETTPLLHTSDFYPTFKSLASGLSTSRSFVSSGWKNFHRSEESRMIGGSAIHVMTSGGVALEDNVMKKNRYASPEREFVSGGNLMERSASNFNGRKGKGDTGHNDGCTAMHASSYCGYLNKEISIFGRDPPKTNAFPLAFLNKNISALENNYNYIFNKNLKYRNALSEDGGCTYEKSSQFMRPVLCVSSYGRGINTAAFSSDRIVFSKTSDLTNKTVKLPESVSLRSKKTKRYSFKHRRHKSAEKICNTSNKCNKLERYRRRSCSLKENKSCKRSFVRSLSQNGQNVAKKEKGIDRVIAEDKLRFSTESENLPYVTAMKDRAENCNGTKSMCDFSTSTKSDSLDFSSTLCDIELKSIHPEEDKKRLVSNLYAESFDAEGGCTEILDKPTLGQRKGSENKHTFDIGTPVLSLFDQKQNRELHPIKIASSNDSIPNKNILTHNSKSFNVDPFTNPHVQYEHSTRSSLSSVSPFLAVQSTSDNEATKKYPYVGNDKTRSSSLYTFGMPQITPTGGTYKYTPSGSINNSDKLLKSLDSSESLNFIRLITSSKSCETLSRNQKLKSSDSDLYSQANVTKCEEIKPSQNYFPYSLTSPRFNCNVASIPGVKQQINTKSLNILTKNSPHCSTTSSLTSSIMTKTESRGLVKESFATSNRPRLFETSWQECCHDRRYDNQSVTSTSSASALEPFSFQLEHVRLPLEQVCLPLEHGTFVEYRVRAGNSMSLTTANNNCNDYNGRTSKERISATTEERMRTTREERLNTTREDRMGITSGRDVLSSRIPLSYSWMHTSELSDLKTQPEIKKSVSFTDRIECNNNNKQY